MNTCKTQTEQTLDMILETREAGIPIIILETDDLTLIDGIRRSGRLGKSFRESTPEQCRNWAEQTQYPVTVVRNFVFDNKLGNPLTRALTDFALKADGRIIILQTPVIAIPQGLEPYVEVVTPPALSDSEIRSIISDFARSLHENPSGHVTDVLTANFRGLSPAKISELLNRMNLDMDNVFSPDSLPGVAKVIMRAKSQMLKKEGLLTAVPPTDKELGALEEIKKWIMARKELVHDPTARADWAIDSPKGMLVSGIPGTGKSLLARTVARILNVPLLEFNMGNVLGGLVGESEHKMQRALRLAETMAPCVLWVDEIEKAFSGASSGSNSDSGVSKRIFGRFLTWMQEKEAPCFVFATANDISSLPTEFLRRGRFDSKFYTFMPTRDECVGIFRCVIAPAERLFEPEVLSPEFLNDILKYAGERGKFFTGADIEGIVGDAKFICRDKLERRRTDVPYTAKRFGEALRQAIDESRPYGETNRRDMAKCLVGLAVNRFSPSGSNGLFDVSTIDPDNPSLPQFKGRRNGYDERLYETVAAEIKKLNAK